MIFKSILELLGSVASIVDKETPGFAASTQEKINKLRTEYVNESGKSIHLVDAAKLDSLELELCQLIELFRTSIQPKNITSGS